MRLIKFSGEGCAPCKALAPHFEALDKEMADIDFESYDIAEHANLTMSMGIRSVPALVLVEDSGTVKAIYTGYLSKKGLKNWVESYVD